MQNDRVFPIRDESDDDTTDAREVVRTHTQRAAGPQEEAESGEGDTWGTQWVE